MKKRSWGYWGFVILLGLAVWATLRTPRPAGNNLTPNATLTAVAYYAATAEARALPLIAAYEAIEGVQRVEYAAVQLNEGEAWAEARVEGAQAVINALLAETRRLFPNTTMLTVEIRDAQRLSYLWESGNTTFSVLDLSNGEMLAEVEVER